MKRTIHNFVQGSPEWHAYRATPKQFNASDAPAMLGESPYKSRDKLLQEIATGVTKEINAITQQKFDDGHRFEEEDRPRAEEYLGQELYPATVSIDLGDFKLSSSLDGWTMCEAFIYEHKSKNKNIVEFAARNEIALVYRIQMEQQLLCSGAEKCLFSASNGLADEEPVRIWYESDSVLREQLIAGWKQFAIDLAGFVLPENEEPAAIAELILDLPTITYSTQFTGNTLALRSNLEEFKSGVVKLAEQSKVKLETDQDFANAIARVKICEDAEARIALVKSMAIGEVVSIDTFTKELDALDKALSQIRLSDKKQVDKRKEEIKLEVITAAQAQWTEHLNIINSKFDGVTLPHVSINLQAAIKGLRTIASLKSKANDELARAKVEANQLAEKITSNIQLLRMIAGEYMELFADLQTICVKDADYIKAIAKQRVDEHKAAEQKRIDDLAQKLADEKIEKERQAELARQQEQQATQQKQIQEVVPEPSCSPVPDEYEQYASQFANGHSSQNDLPLSQPAHSPMYVATKEMQEEFEEAFVDLSDHQKGLIAGLELALKIFEREGAMGFTKAVQDFIAIGAEQAVSKAA